MGTAGAAEFLSPIFDLRSSRFQSYAATRSPQLSQKRRRA